jgi:Restriction endonuclease NaeI
LYKTEKTHVGAVVEIALARAMRLADDTTPDYTIAGAGADVDCKFSHRLGGWMHPSQGSGQGRLPPNRPVHSACGVR